MDHTKYQIAKDIVWKQIIENKIIINEFYKDGGNHDRQFTLRVTGENFYKL